MRRSSEKYHTYYRITFEKSLIISFLLTIITFLLFPSFPKKIYKLQGIRIVIEVEDVPVTRQPSYRPQPVRPSVPIPSDDEAIPSDETMTETRLDASISMSRPKANGLGVLKVTTPRLLTDVFPEYPKEDYENSVTGQVKLHVKVDTLGKVVDVVTLENTTQSDRCAAAAIKAAYQYRFIPARQGDQSISSWTSIVIKFNIKK